jgi:CRP/FNR family transcriptional regulator, cyclic AMP receptor protein
MGEPRTGADAAREARRRELDSRTWSWEARQRMHRDETADCEGRPRITGSSARPYLRQTLEPGPWDPDGVLRHHGAMVLLVEGMVLRETRIGAEPTAELLGPGDVILGSERIDRTALPYEVGFWVGAPSRIAAYDVYVPRPAAAAVIGGRLVDASARQLRRASVQLAISQMPRVEDRVLAMLWFLSERWGVSLAGGDRVMPLRLTHGTIGRLVGARRPTVSLALKQLGRSGLVRPRPSGGWRLAEGGADRLLEEGSALPPRSAAAGD